MENWRAKKWLDSIEKQKRSNLRGVTDRGTDRQRLTESTTKNNRLLARRGDQLTGNGMEPDIKKCPIATLHYS